MSIDPINIGGQANDGNGQSLRSGGALINANFAELDARTATAQATAELGVADSAAALEAASMAQAKADEAVPGSAVGVTVAQLVEGLVPSSQLPSYVDDVLEFPALANFPATGETGKIYIAINDGDSPSNPTRQYRWSGTAYVMIPSSPGSTDQVPEGSTNLYLTAARVRATTLEGLSTSLNEAVAATDSVLTGTGKLQAQVSAAVSALSGKFDKTGGKLTGALNNANIVSLASSATPAIGAAAANTITITGTTGITGFDSIASGAVRTLVFAGAVTLTHNATSLILPKGADITTAAGDVLQFTSLGGGNWRCTGKMVAAEGGAGGGGSYLGQTIAWKLSEASIPAGLLPENGQIADRATYPDLWALYAPIAVDDAVWLASPYLNRGLPSKGNGTTTFRMPDTNGKHADGLTPAAAFLRGYGKNSAGTPGLFQLDQIQNITGSVSNAGSSPFPDATATYSGAFKRGVTPRTLFPTFGNTGTGYDLTFDASASARTGTETRPVSATVIWCTVAASVATNPGAVDVVALAGQVTTHSTQISELQTNQIFTRKWTSAALTPASASQTVLTHNFGAHFKLAKAYLLVKGAGFAGYAAGDRVDLALFSDFGGAASSYGGTLAKSTTTTVTLIVGSAGLIALSSTGVASTVAFPNSTFDLFVELYA
jgi:hypothetical protein